VAPDSVTGIATRLGQVSKQLAAKPAKQEEQRFCTLAATDLEGVASGHADVEQAVAAANEAGAAAAALAASFQAAISAADSEHAGLLAEEEVARRAATAANNERNQANDLAYLYRREAARLRLGEAEAEQEEAEDAASSATTSIRAWEVVPSLAGLAGLKADLDRAEKEAAAEEADLAPLRAEHARHAARLRHRLEALATAADAAAGAADTARRAAAQAVTDEKASAEQARGEEGEARNAVTKARTRLEELDSRRRSGVERGHLPDFTTPPAEHRDIVGGIRDGLVDRLAEIAKQTEERRTQRSALRDQEKQLITDWNTADQVREALTTVTAAQTGWEHLRDTVAPRDLLALLDTPAIARLGSGVVVPTTAADDVVACLEGGGIRTTSLVSVYTAVAADAIIAAARVGDAAEDAPAWTALRRGLVDQDEAAATVRFLKERAQASQREDAELAQRRAGDQTLHDQIATFLDDCPAGRLEAIDADITHWDTKRRGVEQAQDSAQEALKGLDENVRPRPQSEPPTTPNDRLPPQGRSRSTRRQRGSRTKMPDVTGRRPRYSRPASRPSSFPIPPCRSTRSGRTRPAPRPRWNGAQRNRCSPTACGA